ncbi:MAG: T9SS type A sorting domain-containing protein [Saprospiraceae bacterium]
MEYDYESDLSSYVIERSYDSYNWMKIKSIQALNNKIKNEIVILIILILFMVYYRLSSVSNDGVIHYYSIKSIDLEVDGINIYPNPAKEYLFIDIDKDYFNASILDSTGKIILDVKSNNQINISGLTPGVYFIKIDNQKLYKFIKL